MFAGKLCDFPGVPDQYFKEPYSCVLLQRGGPRMYILAAILPNERLNCPSFDPDSQFERTFLDYQIWVNATHKFLLVDLIVV